MNAQQWKKRIKRIVLSLLLCFFCLTSSLYVLLTFEAGNRLVLQTAQRFLPALTASDSKGTLWQGLHIEQLSYQDETINIELKQLFIQLRATDILYGKVTVNDLRAQTLAIHLLNSDSDETATQASEIRLPQLITPFPISIKQLTLQQLFIHNEQQELLMLQQMQAQASWFHHRLHLSDFSLSHPLYQSKLTAIAFLNFTGQWPIQAQLSINTQAIADLAPYFSSPQLAADLAVSGNLHQLKLTAITQQPFTSQHRLQLKPFSTPLAFSWQADWQTIPLDLAEALAIAQGRLIIDGDMNEFNIDLSSQLQWQQQPLQLQFKGISHGDDLLISQAQLTQEQQALQLQGSIQTSPLSWQITGQAKALNLAHFMADLDSQLHFDLATQGQYYDSEQWQADLALNSLQGELQSQAIQGFIRLGHDQQRWWSDSAVNLKHHGLSVQGELKQEHLNLQLKGHSQNLQAIHADSAGQLEFDVNVKGHYAFPQLTGFIKASELAWQQWQLQSAHLQLTHPQKQQLKLSLQQLRNKQQQGFDQLSLAMQGNDQLQQWQLALQANNSNLHSQWQTQQQAKHWQLSLKQFNVDDPWLGSWHLQAGKSWQLSKLQQTIPEFCLIQTEQSGMLCLHAQYDENNAQAQIDLQQFNLAHFAPLLDESAQLNAALNSSVSINYQQKQLSGKLQADINHGYLQFSEDEQELVRIPWQTIALQASLNQQQYLAQLDMALNSDNYLSQSIQGHISDQHSLQGRLQFQLNELRIAELFAPVRQVKGLIHGDLTVTGVLDAPKLAGEITLADAALQVPDAGLELKNVQLDIQALADGQVHLNGQLFSGDKPLTITGQAQQQKQLPWPMDVHIHGQQVQLLNLRNMQLWADPDLHVSLRDKLLINRGEVRVHKAHVTLKDLPKNAISPSSDSVIVGAEEQSTRWLVDTDLRVFLGKDFYVEGMGLKAQFNGDVRIIDQANKPLSLDGTVKIVDGRYKAYGQNLSIERGNLLFQGAPDNPGLDIVATRTLNKHNVKAGLEFSGTLKNPRSRVFSEPAMDESDAMSWLLFGKPLASTSENDGSALVQAIAVYGLEQGDSITHKLSDKLGLDVGFDTDGENDEAAFTLGKQLSSRLYLRYSVALFESLSSIMLRYQISKSVNLETRSSGQSNSIDLLYRKERD